VEGVRLRIYLLSVLPVERAPVFVPFSGPDGDNILLKVNVLYAKPQAFLESEAAPVKKHCHEAMQAYH
jgi:hypothetical protein